MKQIQADAQAVLVIENQDQKAHATAALARFSDASWIEVANCSAAVEWLRNHQAEVVVVLPQPGHLDGLATLRQFWQGPLICFCDEEEAVVRAVESARAFAILPPFSANQSAHALRLLMQLEKPPSTLPLSEARPSDASTMQELRDSERRLEQAQRMEAVGRLAGGIAHDFNNLLTVIGSYSDLAMRRLEDGHVVARYVEQIRKASTTAATLTRQLLAFSRRQVLQPRVFVLNEIVEEISFMVQSVLGAGIELRIRLDPDLGQIEADPAQLQQVLLNLIVNAKDAMPEGGLLSIETLNIVLDERYAQRIPKLEPGAFVRLSVADTGIGMDEATLARIYEPFFTTKPKGHGTGLGLPTVYGIVQQSGGHITVYSETGKGTVFHIYLPRVDKTMEQVGVVVEPVSTLHGRETILLVEDEPGVRELTSMLLQESGYRVLTAATPEEAITLEMAYEGPIDLLLTDVIMPRMTGRELALHLASRRPHMPVVYMSGYTEDVMAFQQLLDIGAYLVEKPFYPNDLLKMLRCALEHAISQHETGQHETGHHETSHHETSHDENSHEATVARLSLCNTRS